MDTEITDEALLSAREGLAGRIADAMLNMMMQNVVQHENTVLDKEENCEDTGMAGDNTETMSLEKQTETETKLQKNTEQILIHVSDGGLKIEQEVVTLTTVECTTEEQNEENVASEIAEDCQSEEAAVTTADGAQVEGQSEELAASDQTPTPTPTEVGEELATEVIKEAETEIAKEANDESISGDLDVGKRSPDVPVELEQESVEKIEILGTAEDVEATENVEAALENVEAAQEDIEAAQQSIDDSTNNLEADLQEDLDVLKPQINVEATETVTELVCSVDASENYAEAIVSVEINEEALETETIESVVMKTEDHEIVDKSEIDPNQDEAITTVEVEETLSVAAISNLDTFVIKTKEINEEGSASVLSPPVVSRRESQTVAMLRRSMEDSEDRVKCKAEEAATYQEQLNMAKQAERDMEEKITKYEMQLSEVMGQLRQLRDARETGSNADDELKSKVEADIQTYQEQIKQDAVAICALEERLDKVVQKNKEYQVEVNQLARTIQDLKTERQSLVLHIQHLTTQSRTPSPHPPAERTVSKVIVHRNVQGDLAAAEVLHLREENAQLRTENMEHLHSIEGLRRDLLGAEAHLSDLAGELSESQKEAMEDAQVKVREKDMELSEVKSQVQELTDLMEKYKSEVINLKDTVRDQKSKADEYRGTVSDLNLQLKDMQNQLTSASKRQKDDNNVRTAKQKNEPTNQGNISKDLTSVGARCKGERHDETIHHQREALAELRSRVKVLEQLKPPPPTTHDQALSQVFILKRELAELRAQQASQTLDKRHHVIRTIQTCSEGQTDVRDEGRTDFTPRPYSQPDFTPSPTSIGLPAISKSLENKQRLTAFLKDSNAARPRIIQNGGERSPEEMRSPRGLVQAWGEVDVSYRGTNSPSIDLEGSQSSGALLHQPAPPGRPRQDTARHSSRSRPRSAFTERSPEDMQNPLSNGRESYESITAKRSQADAEMERSAHSETMKALEISEELFLLMLKTLSSQLGVLDLPGQHALAHLPADQRQTVASDRQQALQVISTRVTALKERIERKDQLLQGYEKDLDKLRKMEQANQQWNEKVDNVLADLRSKTEEAHYLRESLSRTREKLEQEIRLNSAIKLKKDTEGMFASMAPKWLLSQLCGPCRHTVQASNTYHLENEFKHKTPLKGRPTSATEEKKKKDYTEIIKKKNYEIKQLKLELSNKMRDLHDMQRRFSILEDSYKKSQVAVGSYSRRSSSRSLRDNQLQGSITFQDGIVEIPLDQSETIIVSQPEELEQSESMLVSQSEEATEFFQSE